MKNISLRCLILFGLVVSNYVNADTVDCQKIKKSSKRLECFDAQSKTTQISTQQKIAEEGAIKQKNESEAVSRPQKAEEATHKDAEVEKTAEIEKSRQKMEGAYRAAKAIQGSIQVGVNYHKFGELLQNLSTEVSIARDRASNETEKEITQRYSTVIDMYKDSSSLWGMEIDSAGNPSLTLKEGYLQFDFYNIVPLVNKYDLPTHSLDMFDLNKGVNAKESIQIIWDKTSKVIESINSLYK